MKLKLGLRGEGAEVAPLRPCCRSRFWYAINTSQVITWFRFATDASSREHVRSGSEDARSRSTRTIGEHFEVHGSEVHGDLAEGLITETNHVFATLVLSTICEEQTLQCTSLCERSARLHASGGQPHQLQWLAHSTRRRP